jgi:hypothetical protein
MKPRILLIVLALLIAVTGGYFWQRHAAERPLDPVGLEPAAIDRELRESRFDFGLPQALLSVLEAEGRWLQEQGTPGELPANSLDLIAFEPLLAVAPETVTMIRGRPATSKD